MASFRFAVLLFQLVLLPLVALSQPQVRLSDGTGTVTGTSVPRYAIETFLGITYAQPPTGSLRWAKPQPLSSDASRSIDGSAYGKVCPQNLITGLTLADLSEDCLNLDVIRPANVPADEKLPVMLWLYGGNLVSGATKLYNASHLAFQSVMRGQPIIYVAPNYRLGVLGFLASSELEQGQQSGSATLNAGLYDMMAAMQWVQKNIGAFGGDPNKVTVFGQSAGAFGIGSFFTADGGQAISKNNLFRAAILQSGSPSGLPAAPANTSDTLYATLASQVGCNSAPYLDCLRSQSLSTIFQAGNVAGGAAGIRTPYDRTLDGYFHSQAPTVDVLAGNIASGIAVISGDDLDEGTMFSSQTITSDEQIEPYYAGLYRRPSGTDGDFSTAANSMLQLYPDDPSQGSPYEADSNAATAANRFFGTNNQFKRLASITGDMVFHSARRNFLAALVSKDSNAKVYSYLFSQNSTSQISALGVAHGSELAYVYANSLNVALPSGRSQTAATALNVLNAWIAFASTLSPNGKNLPNWPAYGSSKQMLNFADGTGSTITDNFRQQGISFFQQTSWTSLIWA